MTAKAVFSLVNYSSECERGSGDIFMANINAGVVQLVELDNGIVQITMKDEENRNTFSPRLIEGLYKCFDAIAQNNTYKVVILTGYGNYFASGGTKEDLIKIYQREIKCNELDFFRVLLDCKIPVIAAMQGHGIGGGLVLGLDADLVVLSQESIYTTNFMKYGFTPGFGCTLIVPEKLGSALGQEMMYTAQNYRGEELAKRGIPFPVVPRKDVLNYAKRLANELAQKPRLYLVNLKAYLTSGIRDKLPEVVNKELDMHEITFHQSEVVSKIEDIFDETSISQKPQNFISTLLNEAADIQNQVYLFSEKNNEPYTVKQEIVNHSLSREPFQLKISSYGLLNNLTLAPLERQILKPTGVEVQIKAVPVNFRDILNALGMLQKYNEKRFGITNAENLTFGFEGSGTIVSVGAEVSQWQVGDEVIVTGVHDAFSSFVICSPNNLVAKPSNLSMEDAATIVGSFFTAYHGLHNLAKIQPGERVLIHAASGGVGQAAVQLAQLFGAEVFATTSQPKMTFLRGQGIKYVMNSRTTDFANEVMEITQGRGVDIIFNSLTHGEYIQKNIDVLAFGGRYIEIGKLNTWSHEQFSQERPDVKYFPFDLLEECARDNQLHYQIWDNLVQHFECDRLKPLPYKIFPIENVVQAFRYMQHSKHIGKVVVTMPQVYDREEKDSSQLPLQEEVLHQLQSGGVSLEDAEKILLGVEKIDGEIFLRNKSKFQNQDKQDDEKISGEQKSVTLNILEELKLGNISLENAENMLLDIHNNHQYLNEEDYILSDLRTSKISLVPAANLLVNHNHIQSEKNSKKITDKPKYNWFVYHSSKRNPRLRLFCFHGVGGSSLWFKNWSKNLQSYIEVYTVELPGRGTSSKEKPFTDFSSLIKTLGEVISQNIDIPFAFYGHSMGSLICFELAHLLQKQYCLTPIHLFLSGCWSPHSHQEMSIKKLKRCNNLDLNSLAENFDIPPSIVKEGSLLQKRIPTFEADLKLLQSYSQTTKELLDSPISIFGGIEDPIATKKDILEWCHHTTNTFKLQMLPGKHMFIQDSQNQKLILDAITQDLTISLEVLQKC